MSMARSARARDPQRQPQPEHEQHQHGDAPRGEEQDVGAAFVPMMRGAERAEYQRRGRERQDEKP